MGTCKECIHFEVCEPYTAPDESYPEVGGCPVFKHNDEFVQVMRCKDCKVGHQKKLFLEDAVWCRKMERCMSLTGFCSEGIRRESYENG